MVTSPTMALMDASSSGFAMKRPRPPGFDSRSNLIHSDDGSRACPCVFMRVQYMIMKACSMNMSFSSRLIVPMLFMMFCQSPSQADASTACVSSYNCNDARAVFPKRLCVELSPYHLETFTMQLSPPWTHLVTWLVAPANQNHDQKAQT